MGLSRIIRLFKSGNVCVTGLRGTGKDMLFGNVIARRKHIYISNFDYGCKRSTFMPLRLTNLDVNNSSDNFITDSIVPYDYPYPENSDIYVSDAGVYFPAQDCNVLNRKYPSFAVFQALSRHLGNCNFHVNAQNLNRVWDKIREQSDIYIRCLKCRVIGRRVFQKVIVYDKYDSCLNRVEPYIPIKPPLFASSQVRAEYKSRNEVARREFLQNYGSIKKMRLIYKNKSCYDTRFFKKLLGGKL